MTRKLPWRRSRAETIGCPCAAQASRNRSTATRRWELFGASSAGEIPKIQIRDGSGNCEMSMRGIGFTLPSVSFAKLVQRFKGSGQQSEPQTDPFRLSTAAVLLEIAYADGEFSPAEDGDVVGYLQGAFQLSDEDARDLLAQADELRNRTIDHFALTNFIRKNSTLGQRIEIVKTMWRIVYSDRKLTDYENYLVRKLADLLGLEHHVMIEAKVSVLRELGMNA